jgi:hypothetical protein
MGMERGAVEGVEERCQLEAVVVGVEGETDRERGAGALDHDAGVGEASNARVALGDPCDADVCAGRGAGLGGDVGAGGVGGEVGRVAGGSESGAAGPAVGSSEPGEELVEGDVVWVVFGEVEDVFEPGEELACGGAGAAMHRGLERFRVEDPASTERGLGEGFPAFGDESGAGLVDSAGGAGEDAAGGVPSCGVGNGDVGPGGDSGLDLGGGGGPVAGDVGVPCGDEEGLGVFEPSVEGGDGVGGDVELEVEEFVGGAFGGRYLVA